MSTTKKLSVVLASGAMMAAFAGTASALVTPEEAKQLGTTLTPFGSIKAANADGTIPAYTGGLTTLPPNFKPVSQNQMLPDPYSADRPRLRIDAKNMDQYADKLTEGTKALLKKFPDYYIDIYPTRRTVAYPDWYLDKAVKNATTCKTVDGGLGIEEACKGSIPFPIPKTGNEVMWNKLTAYQGVANEVDTTSYYVASDGKLVLSSSLVQYRDAPYYFKGREDANVYSRVQAFIKAPVRTAGTGIQHWDYINSSQYESSRRSWNYSPGQRRVRLAPEAAYDTPNASTGGVLLYDEVYMFTGKQDRFDFKLVGKKEMFVPANTYKMQFECSIDKIVAKTFFINPECERWEQRRVWVVEATLKEGKRHVMSKRRWYLDEDDYIGGMYDAYDQSGQLTRTMINYHSPMYHVKSGFQGANSMYDFSKNVLVVNTTTPKGVNLFEQPKSDRDLTPDALGGAGIR